MAKVAREKDRMGKTNNDRFPDGLRSWLNGPKCNSVGLNNWACVS